MASYYIFSVVVLTVYLIHTNGEHLQVGVSVNNQLAYVENVKLNAIPLKIRTKNVFYNTNDTIIIKGITVTDLDASKAKVTLTAGGVGFTYTNIKMKSERGDGLNYQVQIFA